jgi:succinate dehydrogenase / fumarate reductase cytochrome b subunit
MRGRRRAWEEFLVTTTKRRTSEGEATAKRRSYLADFYHSAVGKKWVMAVTGIIFLGFVLFHMFGNLKLYLGTGADGAFAADHYGEWLRDFGEPLLPRTVFLWGFRVVLAAAVTLHTHAAVSLALMNRRARPMKYQSKRDYLVADYAARTMLWSGLLVGGFVLFHLADLTWGTTNGEFVRGSVQSNVVASFEFWPVAVTYIVANLLLGVHIYHGAWSLFQSIGWNNPRFNEWRRWFAWAFAAVIVIGNVSFPVMVLAGVIQA